MLAREVKIPPNQKNISKEGIDFINKVIELIKVDDSERRTKTIRVQRDSGNIVSPMVIYEEG